MKNQIVFLASLLPRDINTLDEGHTKTANLFPRGGEVFIQLISYGKKHPEFDALIKPGKEYIVKIEAIEE